MGSGASALRMLPERLTERDAERFCGIRFNKGQFDALKGTDGTIDRAEMIKAMSVYTEREVANLFGAYCPNGEMDSHTFLKLLRDGKFLSKKGMSANEVDLVFEKSRRSLIVLSKTISYECFREYTIPEVASRVQMTVDEMLYKLSRMESPKLSNVTETRPYHLHETTDKRISHSIYENVPSHSRSTTSSISTTTTSDNSAPTSTHITATSNNATWLTATSIMDESKMINKAAIKIQCVARGNLAKQKSQRIKAIRQKFQNWTEDNFPSELPNGPQEIHILNLFLHYSHHGEMTAAQFDKLLRETKSYNGSFQPAEADLIFLECKAKAEACLSGPCHNGVLYGKRINFEVFRLILLVDVAKKKGISLFDFIKSLLDTTIITNTSTVCAVNHTSFVTESEREMSPHIA